MTEGSAALDTRSWNPLQSPPEPSSPITKRILCVEADAEHRERLARLMGSSSTAIDLAADAVEAIGFAIEHSYDAIVIDRLIEALGRVSLIRQLRALQQRAAFVVTHGHGETDLPAFEDNGISGLVEKPWIDLELSAALDRAFELSAARLSHATNLRLSLGGHRDALVIGGAADATLVRGMLEGTPYLHSIAHLTHLGDALTLLTKKSYSVILTELSLPDARGLDAIVRLQRACPTTPLLALSQTDDDALAVQAMQAGAQDFVLKQEATPRSLYRAIRYAMERKRANERLHYLASHDPLTNLANRALFTERLNLTLARAMRKQTRFAVLYLDLDCFKWINDNLGHDVGDRVLAVASGRLLKEVREYDTVARLGGDEFAILIDTIDGAEDAQTVAERILASIERPIHAGSHTLELSTSVGISLFPRDGENAGQLIRAADAAMYKAKRSGGGDFRFYGSRRAARTSGVAPSRRRPSV